MSMDENRPTSPILDQVNDAIRENPLAAGLIGAGLAWMLFGSKGIGAIAGVAKEATGKAAGAVVDAGTGLAGGVQKAASGVGIAVRDAASTIQDHAASIVPDISTSGLEKPAETLKQTGTAVREGFQSTISSGREASQVLHSRLSEGLERQPLLLGAIGLAIGAGIASTFATTEIEGQWMGQHGKATREAAQGAFEEAKERAQGVISEVQAEASRQGLNMDAAKEAASTVADKVKAVAGTTQEAIKKPFASVS
jgi:hypothetical protein